MGDKTLKGILLVAGTSIGGGMLALPVMTSLGGFIPSLVIYVLCWLFMMSTGLLFLEVALGAKADANILSMAQQTLGKPGRLISWIIYLFLFYCLSLAYIVGCGDLLSTLLNGAVPPWAGSIIFVALFAPFVYVGTKIIGPFNVMLMLGLIASFFVFVVLGYHLIKPEHLAYRNWPKSLLALPLSFTAFAYQGIIPTLIHYLDRDVRKVRLSIILGTTIPLIAYFVWQGLILGIVPTFGPGGLEEALLKGENAVQPLKNFIDNPIVLTASRAFAFFALLTSFFGVTLGLVDFWADGLQVQKSSFNKLWLVALVFLPPLIVAMQHPGIFLRSLDVAGGYGCALLLGLLPILMVWSKRYSLKLNAPRILPGGRWILSLLLIFVLFELACEIYLTLNPING